MFNLRYLLVMCLFLTPVTVLAEITGSGFHELGCPGSVSATVWLDDNANGFMDANERALPGVKLSMYREDSPELGIGEIYTDANGFNSFDALCDGAFILSLDTETMLGDVQFSHLYLDLQIGLHAAQWRVDVETVHDASQVSANNTHLELALRPSACGEKSNVECCHFNRGGFTCVKPIAKRKLIWYERRDVDQKAKES